MEQLERIKHMDEILNRAETTLSDLRKVLKNYKKMENELDELEDYYVSKLWRKDFDDDEAGKLPADLKRGVLSEDGIWNVMTDRKELIDEMKKIVK